MKYSKEKVNCLGCKTKYGSAIIYCRECDGNIPIINKHMMDIKEKEQFLKKHNKNKDMIF